MSSEDKKDNDRAPGSAPQRRPYVKPAFRHEKVFETMALGCGKLDSTGGPCAAAPKLS